MSDSALSLSTYYIDARDSILSALSETRSRIMLGTYNSDTQTIGEITSVHIPEGVSDTEYANISLHISYQLHTFGAEGAVIVPVSKELEILSTAGDIGWTKRTKDKIFDGTVPTSVVVDPSTREIFLLYIMLGTLKLQKFGSVTDDEMSSMENDISEREPYRLKLDYDALFMYFDGAFGIDQLKESLYIEFNCGVPIHVLKTATPAVSIEGV